MGSDHIRVGTRAPQSTDSEMKAAVPATPAPVETAETAVEEPAPPRTGIANLEVMDGESSEAGAAVALRLGLEQPDPRVQAYIEGLPARARAGLTELSAGFTDLVGSSSGQENILQSNAAATLNNRWNAFLQSSDLRGGVVDVNALVQHVLRESYMETTQDLYFYAEKVKFFNECKKQIRDELTRARDAMTPYAGAEDDAELVPPFVPTPINTDFVGGNLDEHPDTAAAQQAASALQTAQAELKAEQSGAGVTMLSAEERQNLQPAPLENVFITEGGYRIDYQGHQTRIYQQNEDGSWTRMTEISGDPHVYEGSGGGWDWHFGDDSTFLLPDGTKISLNTQESSPGVFYTVGIDILSGDQHAQAGKGFDGGDRTAGVSDDRAAWDAQYSDSHGVASGVFALRPDGQWSMLGSDGQFRDVDAESWDEYKRTKDVTSSGNITAVTDQQAKAALDHLGSYVEAFDAAMTDAEQFDVKTTKGELDAYIKGMEEKLSSVGDDAQLANVDLQNILQKQQQTVQMMSNISKMLHDTAQAVIRKVGG